MMDRLTDPADAARRKRFRVRMWSVAGFFAVGYFPMLLWLNPVIPMAVAACLVIPYGSRARTLREGATRGMVLGLIAGLAMGGALYGLLLAYNARVDEYRGRAATQPAATAPASRAATTRATTGPSVAPVSQPATRPARPIPPKVSFLAIAPSAVASTALLCSFSGVLSAYFARLRRRRAGRESDT